jgi:hypothetical protein
VPSPSSHYGDKPKANNDQSYLETSSLINANNNTKNEK